MRAKVGPGTVWKESRPTSDRGDTLQRPRLSIRSVLFRTRCPSFSFARALRRGTEKFLFRRHCRLLDNGMYYDAIFRFRTRTKGKCRPGEIYRSYFRRLCVPFFFCFFFGFCISDTRYILIDISSASFPSALARHRSMVCQFDVSL